MGNRPAQIDLTLQAKTLQEDGQKEIDINYKLKYKASSKKGKYNKSIGCEQDLAFMKGTDNLNWFVPYKIRKNKKNKHAKIGWGDNNSMMDCDEKGKERLATDI